MSFWSDSDTPPKDCPSSHQRQGDETLKLNFEMVYLPLHCQSPPVLSSSVVIAVPPSSVHHDIGRSVGPELRGKKMRLRLKEE